MKNLCIKKKVKEGGEGGNERVYYVRHYRFLFLFFSLERKEKGNNEISCGGIDDREKEIRIGKD